ncbi:MAG TPA: glycoside hydrolase family 38 C-terminal domain-containing protein [Terriglobales bacterium]|nr:glycoside hydrolase family 38 C-terminal domain-containing protein [Terriglobales bacterium]
MRSLILLSVMALSLSMPLSAADAPAVLENGALRVEVSAQNGSITRILHKRSNTELIDDLKRTKLFRLLIPEPGYLSRRINSWDQKPVSLDVSGETLTVKFKNLQISRQNYIFQAGTVDVPEGQRPIEVTVTLRLEDEHILSSIEVTNHSLDEVTDVTFPWIDGLVRSSHGSPPQVVLPSLSQRVLSSAPEILVGEHAKPYPALLATSWLNFGNASQSIGIEVQGPPETADAFVSLNTNGLEANSPSAWDTPDFPYIAWNFYPHIGGTVSWKSPPVVIHVHGSDWHTIAAEHREWYRQQNRPDRVSNFDQSVGFATYRLKKDDNTVNWTYGELPKLAEAAGQAAIHDVVIEGWREREGPGNESPFAELADPRIGGAAGLKAAIANLAGQDVNLIFAFHPAVMNTTSEPYRNFGQRWTVKTRRGANQLPPAYTFYTFDYPYQEYIAHYWAVVDPASHATDMLLRDGQRLRDEYGFRNLLLRSVGLQSFLSYNREDPVPPQKVYLAGYQRFLGGLRKLYGNGILIMEGFNDLVNPYANGGYTWSQTGDAEILAYSIPWTPFSNDVEALNYDQANASFARKILVNLIVDGGDGTVSRYPDFAKHLKALGQLKAAAAPYYAQAEFRDHDGVKEVAADPQIIVSAFRNLASKQRGIVLANLSDQKKRSVLGLDQAAGKGHLLRLAGQREEIDLAPQISLELAPYEVVVLGID